jgi:hypothetical protein
LQELKWTEVRDALQAGKTTVIIPTGGTEQNLAGLAVICIMWPDADPSARMKMFIGLRLAAVPPSRLDGHATSAAAIAAKLLTMFLVEDES